MTYSLPSLPYSTDALEPHIDARTMEIHHGKHHQTYVNNLNAALDGHPEFLEKSVDELISNLTALPVDKVNAVRNNGGGHSNHTFFWEVMSPTGGGSPNGSLLDAITSTFGSFDNFKEAFTKAALTRFGSGWVYLVLENGDLKFKTYPNADNPVGEDVDILAAFDVWEHSYYLDYKNDRKEHLTRVVNELINYKFIASRLLEA